VKIKDVVCSKGKTGFYFDDQQAIRKGAKSDGLVYKGEPVTPGFKEIRMPGESVSVMLVLENGEMAFGDCAAVQYSGVGGRDPLFLAEEFIPVIEEWVKPKLIGQELDSFRRLADMVDEITWKDNDTEKRLHTAIRYGVTQAIIAAVATAKRKTIAEVIAEEYNTKIELEPIPMLCQSGDDRYLNSDKMILKKADVMPHALINNVATKLGKDGEILMEFARWLRARVEALNTDPNYVPTFHFDVYGTLGEAFDADLIKIVDYLEKLREAVGPHSLQIEGPVDMGNRELQIETLQKLCALIDERGLDVKIIADEWCNNLEDIKAFADAKAGHIIQIKSPDLGGIQDIIEAVLYCREKGVGAYIGGTCNETDRSVQISVHVALATRPMQMLARPGMGVDEGFMIMYNEMMRTIALLEAKK
jgi:methylaspartate ammonia-lyase